MLVTLSLKILVQTHTFIDFVSLPLAKTWHLSVTGESMKSVKTDQGGTLIFFYTYEGSSHFLGVQNFEFQYFWGLLFLSHHKIGLYLGVISMHFRVFLKVKVQNGGYFLGLLKFQIFS